MLYFILFLSIHNTFNIFENMKLVSFSLYYKLKYNYRNGMLYFVLFLACNFCNTMCDKERTDKLVPLC